ncbi:hypothetical protein KV201_03680 [Shewanella sp. SR1]|uniref:hypothetical protein n=1 Tax=Shewanella sp. SR1 TaxID=2855505 RepID=UPI001CF23AAA|nr:hypothetical protein [Shewanella sp. SR1]MCB2381277.1 hypothetical protein [Shewanella sp. SR1]
MNIEQRIALYEKLYQEEVNRGELLNARLNVPLTVFVALIGLLSFIFQNIPDAQGFEIIIFRIFWGLSCLALFVAFRFFCLAWYGHKNKFFPTAEVIDGHYLTLRKLYFTYPNAKKLTEESFKKFMLESYREYATTNASNNDSKSEYLSKVTLSLTCAVCLSFITLMPYQLVVDDVKKVKPQKEKVECQINVSHRHHHQTQVQEMLEVMYQDHRPLMCQDRQHLNHQDRSVIHDERFQD